MKRVLVLGATGGIGKACCDVFGREDGKYEIFGVSRSGAKNDSVNSKIKMIAGDLRDPAFRSVLVKDTRPHTAIVSFGTWPKENSTMLDSLNEFALSIIDLFEKCESDGTIENFVVISSLSAQTNSLPHVFISEANHQYIVAKRFLSDFFRQKMLHARSKSKILLLEPGFVRSKFADVENRFLRRPEGDVLTRANYSLVEPTAIADLIHRTINDPNRTPSSVTLYNQPMK